LRNLTTLEPAARLPVVRPLLGLDKVDIIRLAQRNGTYETSLGPELCDLLGPGKPATQSRLDVVQACEDRLRLDERLDITAITL
jgi:thiamine biosynthesis protein ThiI